MATLNASIGGVLDQVILLFPTLLDLVIAAMTSSRRVGNRRITLSSTGPMDALSVAIFCFSKVWAVFAHIIKQLEQVIYKHCSSVRRESICGFEKCAAVYARRNAGSIQVSKN